MRSLEPKTCPMCRETLPADEFGSDVSQPTGLACYCRSCTRIKRRKYNAYDIRKGRAQGIKDSKRQALVVKYGIDVVETMEAQDEYC